MQRCIFIIFMMFSLISNALADDLQTTLQKLCYEWESFSHILNNLDANAIPENKEELNTLFNNYLTLLTDTALLNFDLLLLTDDVLNRYGLLIKEKFNLMLETKGDHPDTLLEIYREIGKIFSGLCTHCGIGLPAEEALPDKID